MKKWFKKTVAVVLTAAMALTVGTPVFAAETQSLPEDALELEYDLIEEMQLVQVPTLMDENMQNEVATYSVMDLTRSASVLWEENYTNTKQVYHTLSCSWLLDDPSDKHLSIILTNDSEVDLEIVISRDSAWGGSDENLAGTPVNLPAKTDKIFKINSNEIIDRITNTMVYGSVNVQAGNLKSAPFDLHARAVFYKN